VQHKREGEWGEGKDQSWSTEFRLQGPCFERLGRQLENRKAIFPDSPVLVLFTSAQISAVEFKFVDAKDGMSEWTYWTWHLFSEEERKNLGSAV
jgi:hypothetical protein